MTDSPENSATELAEVSYPVTMEAIVRYAGASGDFTEVHYDPEALTASGYTQFFAMGMLVAGRLGALVAEEFPDHDVARFRVRFHEPSWVGTQVTCRLTDEGPGDSPDGRSVGMWARDDRGHVIASGTASIAPVHA